jgi:hypothetical protein
MRRLLGIPVFHDFFLASEMADFSTKMARPAVRDVLLLPSENPFLRFHNPALPSDARGKAYGKSTIHWPRIVQ